MRVWRSTEFINFDWTFPFRSSSIPSHPNHHQRYYTITLSWLRFSVSLSYCCSFPFTHTTHPSDEVDSIWVAIHFALSLRLYIYHFRYCYYLFRLIDSDFNSQQWIPIEFVSIHSRSSHSLSFALSHIPSVSSHSHFVIHLYTQLFVGAQFSNNISVQRKQSSNKN